MAIDRNTQEYELENEEWTASLEWVIENESEQRVHELLGLLQETARKHGITVSEKEIITDYINTIPAGDQPDYPGELEIERRIYKAIRWNAMAIVARANKQNKGIGGHISTYSSLSMLLEVGFNHFFRGYADGKPDLVYFQGHATPGVYARSFLEHRLNEQELDGFRLEIQHKTGLPSYPHPRSMPEYWRFPTVSMGLAPIQSIYQARFLKYLQNRGLIEDNEQKVWTFLGDGEMDEPESTGAISIAVREKLDNLIFVINCNLQRLDGPVRGNKKIVNELEGIFRGAGWNVCKVLWGSPWDKLLEMDEDGALVEMFNKTIDGELQILAQGDASVLREHFFQQNESLQKLSEKLSDEELNALHRGGHDPVKIFAAYKKAVESANGPTVILAQTVKGYEQGEAGEASNVTHQQKKFNPEQLRAFRDRLEVPVDDDVLEEMPFVRFEKDSEEYQYLAEKRTSLGGWLPERKRMAKDFEMPDREVFHEFHRGSGEKAVTTTSAFVRLLSKLLKDRAIGQYVVPIVPDESRTFGMDALFKDAGIYAVDGQQYEPVDKGSLLFYNETREGAILEEGITEAGAMATFIAAGSNHVIRDFYTIPFYTFYSMFGFQRIGDLIWAAADSGAKGFLLGGISGRTTLAGEGLQHADGQSHLYAMAFPSLMAYDPAFAYELAVIVEEGIRRMYKKAEDIFYYITLTNDPYPMPEMPKGAEDGILKGLYAIRRSGTKDQRKAVNLMGSGAVITEVQKAAEMLEKDFDLPVNIWSVTSYKALYDDARDTERVNIRTMKNKKNFIEETLEDYPGVYVAATDYVKAVPQSIGKWIPGDYTVLGTDGFGRSDTIPALREYFEVDAKSIVWSALLALNRAGVVKTEVLKKYKQKSGIKKKKNPAGY